MSAQPSTGARVISLRDLRYSATASLFEGGDDVPVSVFVTKYQAEQGPQLHVHPYPEVFVVETGTAAFTVGEDELTVGAGNVVVVEGHTPHGFKSAGEETLRVVSVHPNPKVEQTNIER